ncbi:M1 family metallopeptidase [Spirosoma taeanense]|uniref:M1 family metallopeptidase n=1 Tax=Spirosoma taeanense TaxID=2735870 RepID=A0A6M5YAX8_9BACT|nr:M1 family metallopeptidase [Spirosoma taeanense]QJW91135.1 M1 family metallopeptidase [Spirosoma taeanense]
MNVFGKAACGFFIVVLLALHGLAQPTSLSSRHFTHADSLRGSLRPERTGYDVLFYDLSLSVDPTTKSITGSNLIRYKVVQPMRRMQVDLFANMRVLSITQPDRHGVSKPLAYRRDGNAIFITMSDALPVGQVGELTITYAGSPQIARNAPWDGGFVWRKDTTTARNADWVTVACEGTGASLWWPCKDHLADEPDSMRIRCRVPKGLTCVSNGKFVSQKPTRSGQQTEWTWFVHYPINNYNVTLNITDYAHISDTYTAADGQKLALDYFVLPGNVGKARQHFEQVKPMLACYEMHFGKYPFGQDGYKLVEAPYWGMEHQSAVAYGNKYRNNAFGFDFIIIHESGHEYFGNSLSCADHAEMWIHESFTTYAEALYMECQHGLPRTIDYLNQQRKLIKNEYPMLGPLGVNADQMDTDIYYKGTWMLHTLRNAVGDDANWFAAIRALAIEKRLSIVYTDEVIDFLCQRTGKDLRPLFNQYLRYPSLPTLECKVSAKDHADQTLTYRWVADVNGFNLPVQVRTGTGAWRTIQPTREWQSMKLNATGDGLTVNPDTGLFHVRTVAVE